MRRADLVVLLAAVGLLLAALSTPAVPYEYDAAGWWMPRAEWERAHTGATIGMLGQADTLSLLLPWLGVHRHPPASPMIVGALARPFPVSLPVARVAALWNAALLIGVLIGVWRRLRGDNTTDVLLAAGVLACPFVFVHLRSGYVDLSVGATAALLALAIHDLLSGERFRFAWLRLVIVATLLVQLKLEGPIHAMSALVALNLATRAVPLRRRLIVGGALIAVVAVNLAAWQLTLRMFPIAAARPALFVWEGFHPALVGGYTYHLLRHAIDYTTWGVVWPLAIGVAVAARRWAVLVSMTITLGVLSLAFAGGPPLMMVWAAQGIQLNRLLLQALVAAIPMISGVSAPVRAVGAGA